LPGAELLDEFTAAAAGHAGWLSFATTKKMSEDMLKWPGLIEMLVVTFKRI
jgi:hypothetical protein